MVNDRVGAIGRSATVCFVVVVPWFRQLTWWPLTAGPHVNLKYTVCAYKIGGLNTGYAYLYDSTSFAARGRCYEFFGKPNCFAWNNRCEFV